MCDRYSRSFRLIGIQDKSNDACIDGIEVLVSRIPNNKRKLKKISNIRIDAGSERHWGTLMKLANTMSIYTRMSKKLFIM